MVSLQYIEDVNSPFQRESFLMKIDKTENPEGIILATCNRLEYYWGEGYIPEDIVSHLFSVTSGLKSNLVGDTSIQGQVKDAYRIASENKELNKSLHKLFQTALFVGKKVRNETRLSKGAVTYAQAVLDLLCNNRKLLRNSKITILGVNNINEKIIRCLARNSTNTMLIGNRTIEKAVHLANKYNCRAFPFEKLKKTLTETDILITATSAPHLIIKKEIFPKTKEMFILDLAVPNDVDPDIGKLDGVTLIHLSQIEKMVNQNLNRRILEIEKGQRIVQSEVIRFMLKQNDLRWHN